MKKTGNIDLFVEVDLEGVSGVVYGGYGLPYAGGERKNMELLMTLEVNALVDGARQAGARRVVLEQSHPLQRERLVPGCEVVYDAAELPNSAALAFLGRHARAGVSDAVFSHTGSCRSVLGLRVNGTEYGEFGLFAALAGSYGVPTIFVSGDAAAAREARDL
ncbi:MAG TPA: M55 family metallopeptidase, partial [bacterium]|nr:M55 family metallopeptidase [bacterium]